ncbi:MAG: IclR family transcriptional regulator [Deltaproteobacteria bacterium]|nr:IclR family transcriptional regulator [Deltaproteobacteria bacterium]
MPAASTPPIQALEKAIAVFETICMSDAPMRISDMARALGMNKTTVFRILQTFISLGYVNQEIGTDRYAATLKVAAFSNLVLNRIEIRHIARDIMRALSQEVHDSVHLSIKDRDEAVIIEKIESDEATRISFHIGRRSPLYTTGTGKIMLAFMPADQLEQYLARASFFAHTPTTLTAPDALKAELEQIRETGVAFDRGENKVGVSCVAAPIHDYSGRLVAGVSIVGPTYRVSADFDTLAPKVAAAARSISMRLGSQIQSKL